MNTIKKKSSGLVLLICLCFASVDAQRLLPCRLQGSPGEKATCGEDALLPCYNQITGELIENEESCVANGCGYENNTCFATLDSFDLVSENLGNLTNLFDLDEISEELLNESRTLSIGGGLDPVLALFPDLPICPKFPDNCQVTYNSRADLEPPVNVPYCQRIACRADNPFLEFDPTQCLTTPGCAYDFNLALYRSVFNQAFLPAVPLCHLAIRNEVFLRNATAFTEQSHTAWNPLYTNCLIGHLSDEIFTETNGCAKLKVLKELGNPLKQAGWKGISGRDCLLINGCWLENKCYFPVDDNRIKTVSKYDKVHFDMFPIGRPQCQPFANNLTKGAFLDQYHTCLRAGCHADVDQNTLNSHLLTAGATALPAHLHNQYFDLVLSGQARADNYRFIFERIQLLDAILASASINNNSTLAESDARTMLPLNTAASSSLVNIAIGTAGQKLAFKEQSPIQNESVPNSSNVDEVLARFGTVNSFSEETPRTFPLCPYQPFRVPGLPDLLGSFEGCCETPLCYLPRSSVKSAHSEIATYMTAWSSWSQCSVSCGPGIQTRLKFCIGELCDLAESEDQTCNLGACPAYSSWSDFGECNATCGVGVKSRYRQCLVEPCAEDLLEMVFCNTQECPIILYSPWTDFGECDATCGGGIKSRYRKCFVGKCSEDLCEKVPCNTGRCPRIRRAQWSPCSNTCGVGIQRRNLKCLNSGDYQCPKKWWEQRKCESFCGEYRYMESRCNKRTCYVLREPQCLQGNGKPGHCKPLKNPLRPMKKKCFEGRCRCVHSPKHPSCRSNNSNGSRNRGMGGRMRPARRRHH